MVFNVTDAGSEGGYDRPSHVHHTWVLREQQHMNDPYQE